MTFARKRRTSTTVQSIIGKQPRIIVATKMETKIKAMLSKGKLGCQRRISCNLKFKEKDQNPLIHLMKN